VTNNTKSLNVEPEAPDGELDRHGGLHSSYTVKPELFYELTGLRLHPKILKVKPQGSRLLVLLNPPPAEYGGIVLPQQWRDTERGGSGWVISVGPLVGAGCPHPGGPLCDHPGDLLYHQVIFGAYVGKIVRVDLLDREAKSPYITMTDRDIWHVDWNPSENLPDPKIQIAQDGPK
jgi:hypothetical protein